jgi:lauroyl/myristoyl acyltransferase
LGKVCAVGIGANMLIAVFLLPAWWALATRRTRAAQASSSASAARGETLASSGRERQPLTPSSLYRSGVWRLGLLLTRLVPGRILELAGMALAAVYCRLNPQRRKVVAQNLLPPLNGDRAKAEKIARCVFRQFALKIVDLWRYECGLSMKDWLTDNQEWEAFEAARRRGRGVLLLTPHLGNWELGGALLAQRGVNLLAITQAEPDSGLTELRASSRARWGIETVVIGGDGFAFVEIIKRLQEGAVVALLVDRPPAQSATEVEMCGRPFRASVAPAELARATGCALLGVVVTRLGRRYSVRVLPEFDYDRQALGNREARRQLMQQILTAFEPEIRQHADQWFHFVPVWPQSAGDPRDKSTEQNQ